MNEAPQATPRVRLMKPTMRGDRKVCDRHQQLMRTGERKHTRYALKPTSCATVDVGADRAIVLVKRFSKDRLLTEKLAAIRVSR
jgi:hypothetical protein